MFDLFDISGSGLTANKTFMEVTSNNIANAQTTRTEDGGPYKRQSVSFAERKDFDNILQRESGDGVEVDSINQDDSVKTVYKPDHPDANEDGYVEFPEINTTAEMSNMLMAQRGFEASSTALNTAKQMMDKTLEIGRY